MALLYRTLSRVKKTSPARGLCDESLAAAAEALELEIRRLPPRPDVATYESILRRCAAARSLHTAKRLEEHISSSRLGGSRFLCNHIVSMYGSCGSIDDAAAAFSRITKRNVFSWNILTAAFAQGGHLDEAGRYFHKMPAWDVVSWTTIIAAYAQSGRLSEAAGLFTAVAEPTVACWNALISGYSQAGQWTQALSVFRRMDLHGVEPDKISFVSILNACSSIVVGRLLHDEVDASGIFCTVLCTALVTMYGTCGYLGDALAVFSSTRDKDIVPWNALLSALVQNGELELGKSVFGRMPQQNAVSGNMVISAYTNHGDLQGARSVFDTMAYPSVVSWSSMIYAYSQSGLLEDARDVFEQMPSRDVVSWNTVIAAYALHGSPAESVRLFQRMDLEGFLPNKITFTSVLDACSCLASSQVGKLIHADFVELRLALDEPIGTALINMYGNSGDLVRAVSVFQTMPSRNLFSWNALISVYDDNGYCEEAIELFQAMVLEGESPDQITFISTLAACAHVGHVDTSRDYFVSMVGDYDIGPVLEHYLCIADLLGRSGMLDKAQELLSSMPFEPDDVALTSLLAACSSSGNLRQGASVAEDALQVEPGNTASYVLLSNAFTCDSEVAATAALA